MITAPSLYFLCQKVIREVCVSEGPFPQNVMRDSETGKRTSLRYTAFLQFLFPGKIDLLMPKFADRFEDLEIIDDFFNTSEIPGVMWERRSDIRTFSMNIFHITC
jgi:hypothetical protein